MYILLEPCLATSQHNIYVEQSSCNFSLRLGGSGHYSKSLLTYFLFFLELNMVTSRHLTCPLQSTQMRMAEGWMLKCTPVHGWRLDCQWAKNQLFLRQPLHLTCLHESHGIVSACACPCELWSVVVIVPTLLGLGHSLHCGFHGFQKPLIVRASLAPHPVMFHVSINRTSFPDHIVIAFIFQVWIETNHLVHTQALWLYQFESEIDSYTQLFFSCWESTSRHVQQTWKETTPTVYYNPCPSTVIVVKVVIHVLPKK